MKVSYNWLKNYLDFNESPEELGAILTQTGLEVEHITHMGSVQGGLQGVVVGEVLRCEKHPQADKLKLTLVDVGKKKLSIVCGAPNVAVGQKVLIALVGTTIYPVDKTPLTIQSVKIRGEESNGMICAEDELGIGNSHDGILILPESAIIGTPASKVLQLEHDAIFEIGLTPNRCDAMSHIGVARDIRAYMKHHKRIEKSIQWPVIRESQPITKRNIAAKVHDSKACSRYMIGEISGVTVGTSPTWLQQRLKSIGISPINNVVDCTNYVMHEMGTPMHAFDRKYFTKTLDVRFAENGETITTLDGKERKLRTNDLLIVGDGIPQCMAGIMGGEKAKVTELTTDLLLESAYFDPSTIRKSSKLHGIHSDSSFRFERGVDPGLTEFALQRLMDLILEVAGGSGNGITLIENNEPNAKQIELSCEEVNQFLGSNLTQIDFESILFALDFVKTENGYWVIPAYRSDVTRPVDVIEEIVRIIGFDAIPINEKWSFSIPKPHTFSAHGTRTKISTQLAARGYQEVLNNSLTKAAHQDALTAKGNGSPIFLKNPLSQDLSMLRNSMVYGIIENMQYNKNRQASNVKFFEFGHTYHQFGKQMVEKEVLILGISGSFNPESWLGSRPFTFQDLKSDVETIINLIQPKNTEEIYFENHDFYSEGIDIKVDGKFLVRIGLLSSEFLKQFDLKPSIFVAEVDWKAYLEKASKATNQFTPLPKTLSVRRDFAFLIDDHITYNELKKASQAAASELLLSMNLFDVYEGDKIEKGKKSYALSFHFRDNEKTLTDAEIDQEMQRIHDAIVSKFGAQLR